MQTGPKFTEADRATLRAHALSALRELFERHGSIDPEINSPDAMRRNPKSAIAAVGGVSAAAGAGAAIATESARGELKKHAWREHQEQGSSSPEEIAATAKEFKVFYAKVPGKSEGSYTMDHTAGAYLFDPQGRVRVFTRYGSGPEALAHDVKALLAQG